MAFVHEDSCQCAKSELDLFCLPPTQTSILKSRLIEYSPISILGNGPVEFAVSGSGEDYTDLANTYLHVICKVLHSDGSKLKEGENIAGPSIAILGPAMCESYHDTNRDATSGASRYIPAHAS